MANSDLVQSVAKALDVLKYIASTPGGCRLCDLAAHFGMKPPALHNILRTMTDRGFLRKTAGGVYSAGDALQEIADVLPDRLAKAEDLMRRLRDLYPAAVITLGEITEHAVVCRRRLSPDMPGVMQNPAGRCFPPYAGVTGLVTLSHSGLSADELESRWPFDEFGESAWESREALLDAMEMCRKDGFAVKRSAAGLTLAFFLGCGRTIGFCLKDPAEKAEPVLRTVKSLIAAMKF